ncbi:hypothetical protein K474DRAFT_1666064 [Panus rudis PR-1116 ss-1]|nr:hypothetical protein K474DRAFT_1666064 [Panus rudis PR-1116 ss-1]
MAIPLPIEGVESFLQDAANVSTVIGKNYGLVKSFLETSPVPTMRRSWINAAAAAHLVALHSNALGPEDVDTLRKEFISLSQDGQRLEQKLRAIDDLAIPRRWWKKLRMRHRCSDFEDVALAWNAKVQSVSASAALESAQKSQYERLREQQGAPPAQLQAVEPTSSAEVIAPLEAEPHASTSSAAGQIGHSASMDPTTNPSPYYPPAVGKPPVIQTPTYVARLCA